MASSRARRAALLVLGGTALVLAAQAGSETTGGRDDARAGDRQQGAMVGGQNPANSGPTAELVDAELGEVVVVPGGDWTMPEWARPRTGITEVANFHLSETPAYGSSIRPDGHLAVTPVRPGGAAGRVVATENECYQACGFETTDPDYAVVASNLKALQLRMNWMYVETTPSRFRELPDHWDWVRLSLGHTAPDSPDAWAALREAEDTYWADPSRAGPFGPGGRMWAGRPYVRNLERFLVQRDVAPRAVPVRSTADVHIDELTSANGAAYEGLSTDLSQGSDSLAFDLDDDFAADAFEALVKVTYLDRGTGGFALRSAGGRSPVVEREDPGEWRTATLRVPALTANGAMRGGTDLWLTVTGEDLDVWFVRVVRRAAP